MTITMKSKIIKHTIKLPEWVQIPDGAEVRVSIETEITKKEKRSLAKNLCGTWANDPSTDSIFEEIRGNLANIKNKGGLNYENTEGGR